MGAAHTLGYRPGADVRLRESISGIPSGDTVYNQTPFLSFLFSYRQYNPPHYSTNGLPYQRSSLLAIYLLTPPTRPGHARWERSCVQRETRDIYARDKLPTEEIWPLVIQLHIHRRTRNCTRARRNDSTCGEYSKLSRCWKDSGLRLGFQKLSMFVPLSPCSLSIPVLLLLRTLFACQN